MDEKNLNRLWKEYGAKITAHFIKEKDAGAVKLCLDAGADIDIDYKGITMLQLAVLVNSTEIMQLLIERGANIHSKKENLNGMSLLHFAAGLNHFNSVRLLIKLSFKVNINDDSGMTPLHWACKYTGKVKMLEFLLNNGADVNAKDIKGNTPLHYAVQKTRDGSVRFLMDNGADIYIKNNYGKMPSLMRYMPMEEYVERLKSETDICAENISGKAPLPYDAGESNMHMVDLSLQFQVFMYDRSRQMGDIVVLSYFSYRVGKKTVKFNLLNYRLEKHNLFPKNYIVHAYECWSVITRDGCLRKRVL